MKTHAPKTSASSPPTVAAQVIGCVSYLNAKPLIDGMETHPHTALRLGVPSKLLAQLESGDVDIALCPVIDYHRSAKPLRIVPVGGIGCAGPTLTVRLYSPCPFESITRVLVDSDSHTSVVLLQIILSQRYGVTPQIIPYHRSTSTQHPPPPHGSSAMLLIGDKVVTDHPPDDQYPHQLDLGEAWHELTGLPFVFATWMTRTDTQLGNLPAALNDLRLANATQIDRIAAHYATGHGWEPHLAGRYLGQYLQYEIGPAQLQAIERFSTMAHQLGLIERVEPIRLYH